MKQNKLSLGMILWTGLNDEDKIIKKSEIF